jgi:hypothetical protein
MTAAMRAVQSNRKGAAALAAALNHALESAQGFNSNESA